MAIILINPNSTAQMTRAMVAAAEAAAPQLTFEGWTSEKGPAAIQGAEDGDAATPPLLELVGQASDTGADGIIIGCFDDTALKAAAARAACPVIGLGQASYHYAALRNWRFSVVTTLGASVPVLQDNISQAGLDPFLGQVRASEVPVLELETATASARDRVRDEALRAQKEDRIDAVILGCGGMSKVVNHVRDALTVETIDPVTCAARCMLWFPSGDMN